MLNSGKSHKKGLQIGNSRELKNLDAKKNFNCLTAFEINKFDASCNFDWTITIKQLRNEEIKNMTAK